MTGVGRSRDAGWISGGNLLAVELVRRHFLGPDLNNAGAEPLQSDDDHPVAGGDATAHQPLVADGPLGLDHACADWVIGANYHRVASPSELCEIARCETSRPCSLTPSSSCSCTNMPGSRMCCGLGNTARSVTEPVPESTATSANCNLPVGS